VSDAIYERYKEALRRGHVAALRDRLDAALVAYGEAAEIAPERALPHASVGSVLLRLGRPEEALAAYTIALLRAPGDESAQAGRAEALAAVGQVVEAADSLDRLAVQQETDGKASAALATARRALELAESRTRRKHVETLTAQVGVAGGALLPEPETDAPVRAATPRPEPEPEPAQPPVDHWAFEDAAEPRPEPVPVARPEPAPEPRRDGAALSAEAEDRLDAGDPEAARDRLLAAAASHRASGAIDAALDACYMALAIAPADPELHLALAELYLDRGWRGPAADKLLLLGRLVDFARDGTIRERVCELVANRFADDPRLTALCA
jgi:tetratricopeptide (TPR) repeat protein